MTKPEQVRDVTKILDDGRYAIACVRARVAGEPLPPRRPACFFDPATACRSRTSPTPRRRRGARGTRLRARRRAGQGRRRSRHPPVMVGASGCPTGRAAAPTRRTPPGYFGGFGPMEWMFMGVLFGGGFDGLGEGLGDLAGGIGDGIGHRRRHRRRLRRRLRLPAPTRWVGSLRGAPAPSTPRRWGSGARGWSSATVFSARARTGPRSPRWSPNGTACCCWRCPALSPPWTPDFDYLDAADQVAASLPDEPVAVVGHSMGRQDRDGAGPAAPRAGRGLAEPAPVAYDSAHSSTWYVAATRGLDLQLGAAPPWSTPRAR